ncbi:unnamed protein product [Lactuca saligna]|uniref:Uncharacterized protein n=1 Tax=Lactuca saligna TaxID=75948 RepID=A0AA35V080_LACSI|nr:unnamed protein product [Lactuca saligna]
MSRHAINGGSRQTVESAPPRLIRVERRPSMEKKLATIKEDECSSGDQLQNFHGNRAAAFASSSSKTLNTTKHYACPVVFVEFLRLGEWWVWVLTCTSAIFFAKEIEINDSGAAEERENLGMSRTPHNVVKLHTRGS